MANFSCALKTDSSSWPVARRQGVSSLSSPWRLPRPFEPLSGSVGTKPVAAHRHRIGMAAELDGSSTQTGTNHIGPFQALDRGQARILAPPTNHNHTQQQTATGRRREIAGQMPLVGVGRFVGIDFGRFAELVRLGDSDLAGVQKMNPAPGRDRWRGSPPAALHPLQTTAVHAAETAGMPALASVRRRE